jgi:hypothetical protein
MPDIVITINEDWLTIDGPLPEGYRLIVHNHSGNPDFYPYVREVDDCRYLSPVEEVDEDEGADGVQCFEYTEP